MHNDGLIIGTEFDQNMFGFEIEPLELVLNLTTELKKLGKTIDFQKFEGISDLENQIKNLTE